MIGEIISVPVAVKAITKAVRSIIADVHSIAKDFNGIKAEFGIKTPRLVGFLDRVLGQTVEIIDDYLAMFRILEKGITGKKTEAQALSALADFQMHREELLLVRRALFAELSQIMTNDGLLPLHSFCLSVMRLLDVSELHMGTYVVQAGGTLTRMILAELDTDEPFTAEKRAVVRARIDRARDFLDARWQEILRSYYPARVEISGRAVDAADLNALRNRVKPQPKRKLVGTKKKKKSD
jgi:hypothetical protein